MAEWLEPKNCGENEIPAKMLDGNRRAEGISVRIEYIPLHFLIKCTYRRPAASLNQCDCIPAFAAVFCWTPTANIPLASVGSLEIDPEHDAVHDDLVL